MANKPLSEMTRAMILIDTIEKVKDFSAIIGNCPVAADLATGRFLIDAKSLMGVFSLDVSKPIELRIHSKDDVANETLNSLKQFIVGEAPKATDSYAQ